MTDAKFTKGPWTICWSYYNGERYAFHIVASPHGSTRPLCENREWQSKGDEITEEDRENLIANANLIAAAPDMFRALSAAQAALKSYQYGNASPDLAIEIAAFASNVLKKAEGRE